MNPAPPVTRTGPAFRSIVSGTPIKTIYLVARPKQCQLGGVEPAHAMHPAAGRRRCRTKVQVGGPGGVAAYLRAKKKLPHGHGTAADVASHQICLHGFQSRRRRNMARKDAVAETRRKPLDLRLDAL